MALESLGLLVGHLLGDYIMQNDWMAKNKVNPHPGKEPHPNRMWLGCGPAPKRNYPGPWALDVNPDDTEGFRKALAERNRKIDEWNAAEDKRVSDYVDKLANDPALSETRAWWTAKADWWLGHLACSVHCLLYTTAVALACWWFLPWWAYLVIFLTHWPVDRWRLAKRSMLAWGQKEFATGPMAPWSVIVVDNTIHLAVLYVVAQAAGVG